MAGTDAATAVAPGSAPIPKMHRGKQLGRRATGNTGTDMECVATASGPGRDSL